MIPTYPKGDVMPSTPRQDWRELLSIRGNIRSPVKSSPPNNRFIFKLSRFFIFRTLCNKANSQSISPSLSRSVESPNVHSSQNPADLPPISPIHQWRLHPLRSLTGRCGFCETPMASFCNRRVPGPRCMENIQRW